MNRTQLISQIAQLFRDNNRKLITPAVMRNTFTNIINSFYNIDDDEITAEFDESAIQQLIDEAVSGITFNSQVTQVANLTDWAGKFDSNYVVGSKTSPAFGNIPNPNFVNAAIGATTTVIHQGSTAPTFPSSYTIDLASNYSSNMLNLISFKYVGNSEVIVQIIQIGLSLVSILETATHYLDGASIADAGTAGGAFTAINTITVDSVGYNLGSNGVLHKEFQSALNIGTNGTESFAIVLWANLAVTSASQRPFLQIAQNLLASGNEFVLQTESTDDIRVFRNTVAALMQDVRNGTMKKYYIRSNGSNIDVFINPVEGGTSEATISLLRPTGDMILNHIALGRISPSALTPLGNPIIGKLAVWRGSNVPTFDQVANLTL